MMQTELPVARKVVMEVLAGVGDVIIMEKYGISPSDLLRIKNAIKKSQPKQTVNPPGTTPPREKRKLHRNNLLYKIPIRDSEEPRQIGFIVDVSGRGIQTIGIQAETGIEKKFLVSSGKFNVHNDFFFTARCCWTKSLKSGELLAGFIIMQASKEAATELTKLVNQLTL